MNWVKSMGHQCGRAWTIFGPCFKHGCKLDRMCLSESKLGQPELNKPRTELDPQHSTKDESGEAHEVAGAVRTGGKGSMRRQKKAVHKTTTADDKRLQSTLKRIGVNVIPSIEEVNIFKDDIVIQFLNPKVLDSIPANIWVVSGSPQTKKLQDLLPGIISQLGADNLDNLRRLADQFQKQPLGGAAAASAREEDNDEVPDLVPGETFEAAADEVGKTAS